MHGSRLLPSLSSGGHFPDFYAGNLFSEQSFSFALCAEIVFGSDFSEATGKSVGLVLLFVLVSGFVPGSSVWSTPYPSPASLCGQKRPDIGGHKRRDGAAPSS